MCILYALVSSHAKKRRTPYQTSRFHSPSPSMTQERSASDRSRHGTSSGDAALAREPNEVALALAVGLGLPGLDRAAAQAEILVRNDEPVIDADGAAEAAAGLAGADRGVEAEAAWVRLPVRDIAVGAVQAGRESKGRERGSVGGERVNVELAFAEAQRRFDRLDPPPGVRGGPPEAVLDDLQRAPSLLVDARITLPFEQRANLRLREILRHGDREGEHEARIAEFVCAQVERVADAFGGIAAHGSAASAAMQYRGARVQELQMIVEFGHRADRRSRRAHGIRLIDRDGGRNAVYAVDLWLVHPIEKLPRVRREGFDVAPLALRIERVEDQRRLARAADAGHDGHAAERQIDIDVLEIVLAGAANADRR